MESQARDDADVEQRTGGDPTRGAAGLKSLETARAAAMKLCATTERTVLLHGDFLDKNLLRPSAGYAAIDPIPRIVQAADQQAPALDLRVPRCGALFLVPAGTAKLNPYRRTPDGEELMPYQRTFALLR